MNEDLQELIDNALNKEKELQVRSEELALQDKRFADYLQAKKHADEEWEDYKPAEPLIEDEKIRNLVREWIKLWEIEDKWHVCDNNSDEISIARGDIALYLPLSYGIKDGYYTIAELCGEEEE